MAGSTNILQFDPSATNMLSDADYTSSTSRTGGVGSGLAQSALHNKLFYQTSTVCLGIAQALANLGYTINDSSVAGITSAVSKAFTAINAVVAKSANFAPAAADVGSSFLCTNSITVTMTAAATLATAWWCEFKNIGTGTITLTTSGGNIDSVASVPLFPGQSCMLLCDGTNFQTFYKNANKLPTSAPVWASTTTLTMLRLRERDSTDVVDINSLSSMTLSVAGTGLNGLDAGTVANSTWYYLYAVTNGTTVGLLASTVNEAASGSISVANYAYTFKRQLPFAFKTDGSAHIQPFYVDSWNSTRPVVHLMGTSTRQDTSAVGTFNILNAGANTTSFAAGTVSASSFVPAISTYGNFFVSGASSGNTVGVQGKSATPKTTYFSGAGPTLIGIDTDSSQNISYQRTAGSGGVFIDVESFVVTGVN